MRWTRFSAVVVPIVIGAQGLYGCSGEDDSHSPGAADAGGGTKSTGGSSAGGRVSSGGSNTGGASTGGASTKDAGGSTGGSTGVPDGNVPDGRAGDASPDRGGAHTDADAGRADGGGSPEAGSPSLVSIGVPEWVRSMAGLAQGNGTALLQLPGGDVFFNAPGGLYGHFVTMGLGETGQRDFVTTNTASAAAWLDGSTGALKDARLLASPGATPSGSGYYGFDVTQTGDIIGTGAWWVSAAFHAGTPYETTMSTVTSGGTNAQDPYILKMSESGVPAWLRRGRSPSVSSATFVNNCADVAALPGGDMLAYCYSEVPGFVFGDGTSGAITVTGPDRQFLARLDSAGIPQWLGKADATASMEMRSNPMGEVYGAFARSAGPRFFIGGTNEYVIPREADATGTSGMAAVVRFDPDGAVLWHRRIVAASSTVVMLRVLPRPTGGVVALWTMSGDIEVRGPSGVERRVSLSGAEAFVVSFGSDGTFEWLTPLGVGQPGMNVAALDGTDVWVTTTLDASATTVPIGHSLSGPLPSLEVTSGQQLTLLHRLNDRGDVVDARVVGADLTPYEMTEGSGRLLLAGFTDCGKAPAVFDAKGKKVPLPDPCLQTNTRASGGFVLSVRP